MKLKIAGIEVSGSLEPGFIGADRAVILHRTATQAQAGHDSPWTHSATCNDNGRVTYQLAKWGKIYHMFLPFAYELDFDKYFPYNNGNGQLIYNEDNGSQLRDPITGL